MEHLALPDNSLQSKQVIVRVKSGGSDNAGDSCYVLEGPCSPVVTNFPLVLHADTTKREQLWSGSSLRDYKSACAGSLFHLRGNPPWISMDNKKMELVIEAPNSIKVIDDYLFYINDWQVNVTVTAPCATKSIKGLDEPGFLNITLDNKKILTPEME